MVSAQVNKILALFGVFVACIPLPAFGESPCGIAEARVLLEYDAMHPPTTVLHLGTRLDVRAMQHEVGLDIRNRQTGEPIFEEAAHGASFYEITAGDVRSMRDGGVRTLETWIYAVILYVDYRGLRVETDAHGYDEIIGGQVRVCIKGKPN